MLKSIKREFLLNRNSLWQSLAVLGGAWLLGEALSLCIMYFAHEERWAWVILPAVLVLACTGLFLGACIQRWGRRALWLLWAAYMAVFLFGDTFTRLAEGAGRDTLLGRALGAVVDVLAFIPGGPARVLLALALLTAATVSGAALLLRGSVRQTA